MALTAFATAEDLAARLGRAVWTDLELLQVQALLHDATAHLQSVIGAQVSPPSTVTVSYRWTPDIRWISAPFQPATVVSVAVDGVAVTGFTALDGAIMLPQGWQGRHSYGAQHQPVLIAVTYSAGFATVPPDLLAWTCVLASQALAAVADLGALGPGGVASIGIDDYRKAWDPNATPGGGIPERVAERLRATYGRSAYVTSDR